MLLVLIALGSLFLLIGHRAPITRTLVLDQVAQPAAWLYGSTYMAAVLWILLDSIRTITRRGTRNRGVNLIAVGAALTAVGCAIEIAVFTLTHFRWGGTAAARALPNLFQLPFFGGLALMLLGVAAITLLGPMRRRILIGRLQLLGYRHHLLPVSPGALLALFVPENHVAGRIHRLLVTIGNAQRAGRFTLTGHEAAPVHQAQQHLHPDQQFRPVLLRSPAPRPAKFRTVPVTTKKEHAA